MVDRRLHQERRDGVLARSLISLRMSGISSGVDGRMVKVGDDMMEG